jgi:GntR family transcriptional regulator
VLPFSVALRPGLPVQDQVVYAVTRAVVSGQLRPGEAFPSVRTLSQELRINPNTAHRIVSTLVEGGLLEVRPGIGTVVAAAFRGTAADRRALLDRDLERFVVAARKAGIGLQDAIAALRRHWHATSPEDR